MYGLILENLAEYIRQVYGEDRWEEIRRQASVDQPSFSVHQVYPENLIPRLAKKAIQVQLERWLLPSHQNTQTRLTLNDTHERRILTEDTLKCLNSLTVDTLIFNLMTINFVDYRVLQLFVLEKFSNLFRKREKYNFFASYSNAIKNNLQKKGQFRIRDSMKWGQNVKVPSSEVLCRGRCNVNVRICSLHQVLGVTEKEFFDQMGVHFVGFVGQYGYDRVLSVLGRHVRDFLNGLDNLHEYLKFSYPRMRAPSFICENETRQGEIPSASHLPTTTVIRINLHISFVISQ